jgi:tellurite resistance protein TehA-like permease
VDRKGLIQPLRPPLVKDPRINVILQGPNRWCGLLTWIDGEIAVLNPGCFAIVMATGIISNAMFLVDHRAIADALFLVNAVILVWLTLATLVRLMRFRVALWADLTNPRRVFSFFTVVAAADVFGLALNLRGLPSAACALWLCALVLWLVLTYHSFGVLMFLNTAEGADVVHGGWLLAIVGTESLVVLGSVIAPRAGDFGPAMFVLAHMLWGVGLALYGMFITLFAYRIFYFDVEPDDVMPHLWVVMGAAAISTNAGSVLIVTDSGLPFLQAMRPFIDGTTLILWAWATWWIPLLILFGVWKHGVRRVPISYTPSLWSLVFPLGMYALASLRLSLASDFPALRAVALAMVWVALAIWGGTAVGLVRALWRSYIRVRQS